MTDYEPFGEEWKAEIMKNSKRDIVELYRTVCLKLKKQLEKKSVVLHFTNRETKP